MMAGLVLAAGEGRRMGGHPKAGILLEGATLLEHAVRTLRHGGCRDIVAVLPNGRTDLLDLAEQLDASPVVNTAPSDGMFSSVRLGLRYLLSRGEPIMAIAILPVDHPCIQHETVAALLAFARQSEVGSVRPSHGGRGGHPVVLAARSANELLHAPSSSTLRDALRTCCTPLCTLPTSDPGVLVNVNTREDLAHIELPTRPSRRVYSMARASSSK